MTVEVISQPETGEWIIHLPPLEPEPIWFDHQYWLDQGRLLGASSGRGSAWRVKSPLGKWMLRHYFRGGLPARVIRDKYLWQGLDKTRAVAEWRLLQRMCEHGLPVPQPVAARVRKKGLFYTADILMQFVPHEQTFSQFLLTTAADIDLPTWEKVGKSIGRLHGHGFFHADLNAHNILLSRELAWLIDFDRGRYVGMAQSAEETSVLQESTALPGWQRDNLNRLRRSIEKVIATTAEKDNQSPALSPGALEQGWSALVTAYHRSRAEAASTGQQAGENRP